MRREWSKYKQCNNCFSERDKHTSIPDKNCSVSLSHPPPPLPSSPSHLADDVEDEPTGPGPAVVPRKESTQWEEQTPGQVHQGPMKMNE